MSVRALVIEAPYRCRVADVSEPAPGPGEVVIKVRACGVCGSDLHKYRGEIPVEYPVIPGHEISGVVVRVGEGVEELREGDWVAVDPNIACHSCSYCREGLVHFCEKWRAIGVHLPGGYAEYVKAPASNVYKLPSGLDFEAAAFAEPLACCLHGHDILGIKQGGEVAVFGLGPIGLLHVQLAKLSGSSLVVGVDLVEKKLRLAERLGADVVVNAAEEDSVRAVLEVTRGRGVGYVIEATGVPKVVEQCLRVLAPKGRLLVFGVCPQGAKIELEPFLVFRKELTILGSFINPHTTSRALRLLASGRVRVKELISHKLRLGDVEDFFKRMIAHDPEVVKGVVVPRS